MPKKVVIASSNEAKVAQLKSFEFLKVFELLSGKDFALGEVEENENTLEGNALIKAKTYHEHTKLPSLSDDTGLFINSLDGYPGTRCGRIAKSYGGYEEASRAFNEKLGDSPDRGCVFACAIAFVDDGLEIVVRGEMPGTFVYPGIFGNCGTNNGYNPYFIPEGSKLTYAQTGFAGESFPHHRLIAARKLMDRLRETSYLSSKKAL
ncbi:MAG: hypothetical protein LBL99_03990 [Holosporaceae bacterium]|jgi:XTP/dITP diphosphohydrolase|nr:hypothetical protein [Holosporaceae bacterium]